MANKARTGGSVFAEQPGGGRAVPPQSFIGKGSGKGYHEYQSPPKENYGNRGSGMSLGHAYQEEDLQPRRQKSPNGNDDVAQKYDDMLREVVWCALFTANKKRLTSRCGRPLTRDFNRRSPPDRQAFFEHEYNGIAHEKSYR